MKKLFITFFDIEGIIHFEFIPQGQTVNQAYFVAILKQLHETVHSKGFKFTVTFPMIPFHERYRATLRNSRNSGRKTAFSATIKDGALLGNGLGKGKFVPVL
jgi:hypothetical protein